MEFNDAVNLYLSKSVNSHLVVKRIMQWDESLTAKELSKKFKTYPNLIHSLASKYGLKFKRIDRNRKEVISNEEND